VPLALALQRTVFEEPGPADSLVQRLRRRFQIGNRAAKLALAALAGQSSASLASVELAGDADLPAVGSASDLTLEQLAVLAYAAGPEPLVVLTARILGLPERGLSGGAPWLLRS
jgi:hypothetical protein